MAHRTSVSGIRAMGSRSPLHLRTAIIRYRQPHVVHARNLWWWTRSSKNSTPYEDYEEERFLRAQRMLRHRHAKIVRRRAMWHREQPDTDKWPWGSRQSRFAARGDHDDKTSSVHTQNRPRDGQSSLDPENPASSPFADMESFKRAVDRAMDRDAYGALFGRRLYSPPSSKSWTSFSWIFDSSEAQKADTKEPAAVPTNTAPVTKDVHGPSTASREFASTSTDVNGSLSTTSVEADQYEYDPISMRKVPRAPSAPQTPKPENQAKQPRNGSKVSAAPLSQAEPPRQSIFDTLFGENAVDIPVKTYEPKVYGYGDKPASAKKPEAKPRPKPGFENSRKREFLLLKASTLGNSIDTAAEFGGKYQPAGAEDTDPSSKTAKSAEDVPFAGTVFEERAKEITGDSRASSAWLRSEGFVTGPTARSTMQPALDRVNSITSDQKVKLTTSLDRRSKAEALGKRSSEDSKTEKENAWLKKVDAAEKAEDIDLLRSSDVRVSMKPSRTSKHQSENEKQQKRAHLEQAFDARGSVESMDFFKPSRIALDNARRDSVQKHVQQNPDGIVARTLRLAGSLKGNDSSTETQDNNDVVNAAVALSQPRHVASHVQPANSVSVRPVKDEGVVSVGDSGAEQRKAHPLASATVKEGVPRFPRVERHVHDFEPKLINVISRMKDSRKQMWQLSKDVSELKTSLGRAQASPSVAQPGLDEDLHASGLDEPVFVTPKVEQRTETPKPLPAAISTKRDTGPRGLDEPVKAPPSPTPLSGASKMQADLRAQADMPPRVQEPVFTPPESSIWNDEQPPPIAELKAASTGPRKSRVNLLLNTSTGQIKISKANSTDVPRDVSSSAGSETAALFKHPQFPGHFSRLWKAGYRPIGETQNTMILERLSSSPTASQKTKESSRKAATVLDEIPAGIEPSPGPSAPIAPPAGSWRPQDRRTPRVKRQEDVFSGGPIDADARPLSNSTADPTYDYTTQTPKDGIFTRVARGFRRVTLIMVALAGGAYLIGVISEGIGAQSQAQRGIVQGEGSIGPRKQMVIPVDDRPQRYGTRPGIYSTESSR
jgi:hypothetical protein